MIGFDTTVFPESQNESDPLHSYMSKHSSFTVKTLSDLKNQSNIATAIKSRTVLKICKKDVHTASLPAESQERVPGSL